MFHSFFYVALLLSGKTRKFARENFSRFRDIAVKGFSIGEVQIFHILLFCFFCHNIIIDALKKWRAWRESNPQPSDP